MFRFFFLLLIQSAKNDIDRHPHNNRLFKLYVTGSTVSNTTHMFIYLAILCRLYKNAYQNQGKVLNELNELLKHKINIDIIYQPYIQLLLGKRV